MQFSEKNSLFPIIVENKQNMNKRDTRICRRFKLGLVRLGWVGLG